MNKTVFYLYWLERAARYFAARNISLRRIENMRKQNPDGKLTKSQREQLRSEALTAINNIPE